MKRLLAFLVLFGGGLALLLWVDRQRRAEEQERALEAPRLFVHVSYDAAPGGGGGEKEDIAEGNTTPPPRRAAPEAPHPFKIFLTVSLFSLIWVSIFLRGRGSPVECSEGSCPGSLIHIWAAGRTA